MVELAVEFGADKNKAVRDQREVHNMLLNIAKVGRLQNCGVSCIVCFYF